MNITPENPPEITPENPPEITPEITPKKKRRKKKKKKKEEEKTMKQVEKQTEKKDDLKDKLKQKVSNEFTNSIFSIFNNSQLAKNMITNEVDPKYINRFTLKQLGINYDHLIVHFMRAGLLPHNFLQLK